MLCMADDLHFSEWLDAQLSERSMTQQALAKKAGLGKSVISKLLKRMIKRPDPGTYVAIAKALDMSPITVFRIAGILPPDIDIPELEDYKTVLSLLTSERRQEFLCMMRAFVDFERKQKASKKQE